MINKMFLCLGEKAQKSWQIHSATFGPIMENAFIYNLEARAALVDALNKISQGQIDEGVGILDNKVSQCCQTNEDRAAYHFFVGIAYEFLTNIDAALRHWLEASKYEPEFYLLYLKLAKQAHCDAVFEFAEENYIKAIECLNNRKFPTKDHDRIISSAYSNLASCLTMMHRYEEALEAFENSEKRYSELPKRNSGKAILFAVLENEQKCKECLRKIKEKESVYLYENTKTFVEEIFNETHAHFFEVEYDVQKMDLFWKWFVENEEAIRKTYGKTPTEMQQINLMITSKLKDIFQFMERELEVVVTVTEKFTIVFADFFSMGLHYGYDTLIERCPQKLKSLWDFIITR